jgi:RNA polymerase sigma factor (sigma-70 family)
MNELKKLHINELVTKYTETKDEVIFENAYRSLLTEYQPKLNYWAATTAFLAGKHEAQELFDESFMRALASIEADGGDFVKLFNTSLHNRFKSLLRKLQVRRKREDYVFHSDDPEAATFELADEFNLEATVLTQLNAKKKADQRQLIDSLLSDADESTTAIVETFLSHPKPTATAIARELGVHHSKVTRALSRLAAKFDPKQYGSHRDYLVAL